MSKAKELTPEEKKAQTAKEEAAERERLAKLAKVPKEEIKPTAREEFETKVKNAIKALLQALHLADHDQTTVIKNAVNETFEKARLANNDTTAIEHDPFTPPNPNP